jgi:hypothetical protein
MWLDKLGEELTKLDKELLSFTRSIDSKKQNIIDATLAKEAKYPIGYQFIHPQYGSAKVVNFHLDVEKQGTLFYDKSKSVYDDPYVSWCDVKSFYKLYFMYECQMYIQGLGTITTNVPEHVINEFNKNLL